MIAFNSNCERRIDGFAIIHRMGELGQEKELLGAGRQSGPSQARQASHTRHSCPATGMTPQHSSG